MWLVHQLLHYSQIILNSCIRASGCNRTVEAANHIKSTQLNPPITKLITITIATTTLAVATTCVLATSIEILFTLIRVVAGPSVQVPLFHSLVNMWICKYVCICSRFSLATATTIQRLENSSNNENTAKSTAFWLLVWKKWCLEQGIAKEIKNYEPTQLNTVFERFYAEIKNKHG